MSQMAEFAAELTAEWHAISALTERVTAFLAESGVDARTAHHVALVLDELLTNVATHNETVAAAVSVSLTVSGDRVSAEVVDEGAMFDPRAVPSPDLTVGVQDRRIGGLGLLLVHRLTEGLAYEREGNRNRTTFSICRAAAVR
jgi:anti-sigma regulatory factor (Ser/Thr protein kinase)